MVTEKRKRKRKQEINEVRLIVLNDAQSREQKAVRALALDMTVDGVKLIAKEMVPENSSVKIEFLLQGTQKRVLTDGKVRWAKSVDHDGKCEMGIEFIDVGPDTFYSLLGHLYKKT
ncbi:MAG: PilZ domain-containing protein [Candidatus Aminicenantes bacterium]|nr:PilZ domain-containing protein [Candidatus Aminicenantes bacterium]